MAKEKTTYELLIDKFGEPVIKAHDVGKYFGMKREAVNNNISKGIFFLPTFRIGRCRYVKLKDLADYIDEKAEAAKFMII